MSLLGVVGYLLFLLMIHPRAYALSVSPHLAGMPPLEGEGKGWGEGEKGDF